jgi:hypothetical protein
VHARLAWVEVVLGTAMLKVDGKVVFIKIL